MNSNISHRIVGRVITSGLGWLGQLLVSRRRAPSSIESTFPPGSMADWVAGRFDARWLSLEVFESLIGGLVEVHGGPGHAVSCELGRRTARDLRGNGGPPLGHKVGAPNALVSELTSVARVGQWEEAARKEPDGLVFLRTTGQIPSPVCHWLSGLIGELSRADPCGFQPAVAERLDGSGIAFSRPLH